MDSLQYWEGERIITQPLMGVLCSAQLTSSSLEMICQGGGKRCLTHMSHGCYTVLYAVLTSSTWERNSHPKADSASHQGKSEFKYSGFLSLQLELLLVVQHSLLP